MTVQELRDTYPIFEFATYKHQLTSNGLELNFEYRIGEHTFTHSLILDTITDTHLSKLSPQDLETYIFTIGLAEMLNYWKLTASPTIKISAGSLLPAQIEWWHKLVLKGMGEYFFVNNIDFTEPNFVTFEAPLGAQTIQPTAIQEHSAQKILIPIGGGKDSAVTLELLSQAFPDQVAGFMINPLPSAVATLAASTATETVTVQRKLDPKLLELNVQGYLNGHVPVSSVIAFVSILAAKLHGYTHIAISNERSSNEGNVTFCDQEINHQYSKTFEFETDLAAYSQTYLPAHTPSYFSFLRPLYELQIAQIFSRFEQYHAVFRSCNRGQKTNAWCGECSKCLFAYIMMVPFLGPEKVATFFGKDMLSDASLYPIAQELLGVGEKKPLECVGTHEETICAFYLAAKQFPQENYPELLQKIMTEILATEEDLEQRTHVILNSWNNSHLIPSDIEVVLRKA